MRGNKFLKYTVVQVVERRRFVTERFVVHDLWYYKSTLDDTFTRTTSGSEYVYTPKESIPLPSTPFEIKFTTKRHSTSAGVVHISVGNSSNDYYDIGALRNKGSLSIRKMPINTLLVDNNTDNVIPLAETENTYTYDGNKHTVTSSKTLTANDTNTIGYFLKCTVNTQSTLKEIKIKPL